MATDSVQPNYSPRRIHSQISGKLHKGTVRSLYSLPLEQYFTWNALLSEHMFRLRILHSPNSNLCTWLLLQYKPTLLRNSWYLLFLQENFTNNARQYGSQGPLDLEYCYYKIVWSVTYLPLSEGIEGSKSVMYWFQYLLHFCTIGLLHIAGIAACCVYFCNFDHSNFNEAENIR